MQRELEEWRDRAHDDLNAARHLRTNLGIPGGVAAFHYQQATEKALKGLLIADGDPPTKTHDLRALLTRLADRVKADHNTVEALTAFAVLGRYPGFSAQVPEDELDAFDKLAKSCVDQLGIEISIR